MILSALCAIVWCHIDGAIPANNNVTSPERYDQTN